MIRYDTVRYGTVRYGTVRYGTVRYGTVRYGTVRYGTRIFRTEVISQKSRHISKTMSSIYDGAIYIIEIGNNLRDCSCFMSKKEELTSVFLLKHDPGKMRGEVQCKQVRNADLRDILAGSPHFSGR
jgi:hypothetical protein